MLQGNIEVISVEEEKGAQTQPATKRRKTTSNSNKNRTDINARRMPSVILDEKGKAIGTYTPKMDNFSSQCLERGLKILSNTVPVVLKNDGNRVFQLQNRKGLTIKAIEGTKVITQPVATVSVAGITQPVVSAPFQVKTVSVSSTSAKNKVNQTSTNTQPVNFRIYNANKDSPIKTTTANSQQQIQSNLKIVTQPTTQLQTLQTKHKIPAGIKIQVAKNNSPVIATSGTPTKQHQAQQQITVQQHQQQQHHQVIQTQQQLQAALKQQHTIQVQPATTTGIQQQQQIHHSQYHQTIQPQAIIQQTPQGQQTITVSAIQSPQSQQHQQAQHQHQQQQQQTIQALHGLIQPTNSQQIIQLIPQPSSSSQGNGQQQILQPVLLSGIFPNNIIDSNTPIVISSLPGSTISLQQARDTISLPISQAGTIIGSTGNLSAAAAAGTTTTNSVGTTTTTIPLNGSALGQTIELVEIPSNAIQIAGGQHGTAEAQIITSSASSSSGMSTAALTAATGGNTIANNVLEELAAAAVANNSGNTVGSGTTVNTTGHNNNSGLGTDEIPKIIQVHSNYSNDVRKETKFDLTCKEIQTNPSMYLGLGFAELNILRVISIQCQIRRNDLFMIIRKIRLNEPFEILANNFEVTIKNAIDIFMKNIPKIASRFRAVMKIQSKDKTLSNKCMITNLNLTVTKSKSKFPNREIISRNNIKINLKYLLSCTHSGFINYVSRSGNTNSTTKIVINNNHAEQHHHHHQIRRSSSSSSTASSMMLKGNNRIVRFFNFVQPEKIYFNEKEFGRNLSSFLFSNNVNYSKHPSICFRMAVSRAVEEIQRYRIISSPQVSLINPFFDIIDDIVIVACGLYNCTKL